MYKQEKIKPYSQQGEKAVQVEQMFNNIAPSYDTLNHRLSLNIDRYWRTKALRTLQSTDTLQAVLDIATGTGDFAIRAAQLLRPREVIGIDLAEEMLRVAQKKVQERGMADTIHFQREDCLHMSFADNTFDAVIAAFGIRNFQQLDLGLQEMYRVLKPGGQLRIVELTRPIAFPMRQLFWIYTHTLLPLYGRLLSGDRKAYEYLTASIEAFPQGETMTEILQRAGFRKMSFSRLTFGICTLYMAEK